MCLTKQALSQQEKDINPDHCSVLITVQFCCPFYYMCKHWWSSLKPGLQPGNYFPPVACHFVLLISLIPKADHHILQQFEFCRGIFPYIITFFFYFKARCILLFLSVKSSNYFRPLQIHHAWYPSTFLVKHTVFALTLNTMKKNILV